MHTQQQYRLAFDGDARLPANLLCRMVARAHHIILLKRAIFDSQEVAMDRRSLFLFFRNIAYSYSSIIVRERLGRGYFLVCYGIYQFIYATVRAISGSFKKIYTNNRIVSYTITHSAFCILSAHILGFAQTGVYILAISAMA
jgi:hypothetical protein